MELRLGDTTAHADIANLLTLRHRLAHLDAGVLEVGIGRDPAVGMLDQDEVAEPRNLVSGVDHLAGRGGAHDRARG